MKILQHTIKDGVEYWEVINPKGYSAQYGDVFKTENDIYCQCIQWKKYGHCSHVDFVLGYPYMKGEALHE
jgi:hypothetical protein